MAELKALVVDDSQAMRRSIVYALQRLAPFSCVEAQDGADAFRRLAQGAYDIVLTDINMPMLDGLKLIHLIRQELGQRTPIVVITTEGALEDRDRALKLGANAYLVKPVQAQQVLDTVRDLLNLSV